MVIAGLGSRGALWQYCHSVERADDPEWQWQYCHNAPQDPTPAIKISETLHGSSVAAATWTRERRRRQDVVQTHVVRELAVVIGDVERMAKHHARTCHVPRLATERHRDLIGELRVIELGEGVLAERERRFELRDQRILGPLCLDGIRRRRVLRRQRRLHRAEIVAEEI